jgi:2-hydroxychromene-2-carboxylate isomerase
VSWSATSHCCWPACWATGARKARPKSSPNGPGLQLPQPHPFNPLALQRLALATAPAGGTPNRQVVELLFRHVWCRAHADPNEPAALEALIHAAAPQRDPAGVEVKAELRARTEDAAAAGLFGVPTLVCDGRSYFGLDALPMLRAALDGHPWFSTPAWDEASAQPPGQQRAPR